MSDIGAVYQVEVTRAGGWLVGDHSEDATSLTVDAAWDFDVDGGTLVIDDEPYEFTSVTFATDPDTGEPVDDEPAVIELATGLVAEALDGDLVLTFPYSETKTALVEAKGFGEAVEVRVPHDLYDKLPEGIWGSAAEAPTVTIVQDGDGWVVEDVLGREPVVDGGFIDPDTLPPPPPVEPVAPTEAPTVTLEPLGLGSLRVSWIPILNPTSVDYRVYLGTSPGNVGDGLPGNLVEETKASSVVTSVDPVTAAALLSGTDYYAAVRPTSGGLLGPISTVAGPAQIVPGLDESDIFPVTETDIADGAISTPKLQANSVMAEQIAASAVNAEHISANSIDGEKLTGTLILGSDITTAETGERHGLSANEGHYSYGPDGQLVFSAKGGNASFTGDVTAVSLNVTDGATWAGANVGASNASTMMASGISAPGSPPNVEWDYDEITLDSGAVAGDEQSARRGLVWNNNHWWVGSRLDDDTLVLVEFDSDGTHVATHPHSKRPYAAGSLTLHGGKFYGGFNLDTVLVWNGDGTPDGTIGLDPPPGSGLYVSVGSIGSDGTNLLWAWRDQPGDPMKWQKYNTSGGLVGSPVNTGEAVTPNAVLGGSFDFGAQRVIVAGPVMAQVYNTSGGNLSNAYDFPSENTRGMAWRTDPEFEVDYYFAGLHSPRKIRIHTNELKGEGRLPNLYVAALWRREPDPVYKTEASRRGLRGFAQRAKHTFSLPVPCPGTGLASDPNAVEFYVGRSKGRTKLEWAGKASSLSPGDFASAPIGDLVLPDGDDDAFEPPPASNTFPMADAYDHYSQAVIPGTTDPQTMLDGDGYARLYGLEVAFASYYRATTTNIPNASNTQVAIAAELETHPCVSYASGGNFTINWPGLYRVHAHFTFFPGSGYRTGSILKNSVDVVDDIQAAGDTYSSVSPSKTLRLAAGDLITVTLYQNSGGALQIFAGEDRAFITFERVGV